MCAWAVIVPAGAQAGTIPTITGLEPSSGPASGGTSVVISGTGLAEVAGVMFGSEPAADFTYDPGTDTITAVAPAQQPGTVQVRLTTVDGDSEDTEADDFTYVAAPVISGLSPASGTTAGGTSVVISGTGLAGASAVTFGGVPATSFTYDSGTETITAVTPAHDAGKVRVQVTTVGGGSEDTDKDDFTYVAPLPVKWYEQTDSRFAYTGTWYTYYTASASNGSYKRADSNSAYVTLLFVGERLDWIATKGHTTGIADVWLDGVKVETIDLYNPIHLYQQRVWSTGKLPNGLHRVKISRNAASPLGKYITVDAVEVEGTLVSSGRVEQSDGRLYYTGTWTVGSSDYYSGGSHRYAGASGASVTADFDGPYFAWIAKKGTNYGIAKVTLDGTKTYMVDLYASSTAYKQKVWETPAGLSSGPHRVKIEWTGTKRAASTGTYVSVDAFEYVGTVMQVPIPTRFEEKDARIAYLGTWSTVTTASASGGTYKRANTNSAGVSVVFSGIRLQWLATVGPLMGKADVSVDGGPAVTVDLHSPSTQYKQKVFSTGELPNAVHRVEISWHESNASGAYITVDAFDVVGTLPYTRALTTAEIKWVEQRLTDLSYRPGPVDGVYDNRTRGAVIAFQKWEGLSRDGVVGAVVWARLQVAATPRPKSTGSTAWIEVNKTKQVLLFCKNNAVVRTLPVSTGTTGDGGIITPSGTFKVTRKTLETSPRYLPMYISNYPYSLLAIHGYPNVPTYPASHGCIRTHLWDEDELYPLVPVGTRVYIYN
jgi:hypothetical protein